MEIKEDFFTHSRQAVKEYLEDRMLLLKLKAVDYTSQVAGSLAVVIICTILFFIFLIMLGITGGLYFAKLTGDNASGFAIMTGVFLVLIILVAVLLKKIIQSTVIHALISKIYNNKKSNHENNIDGTKYN